MFLHVDMFLFLLCVYLRVELLDHIETLCLIFQGTAILSSHGAAPFYIPAIYISIYILNPDFHNPNLQQVHWNVNGLSTLKGRNMVDGIIK